MSENSKSLSLPSRGVAVPGRPKVGVTVAGREYGKEELEIVRRTVMPKECTDFEVSQFLTVCQTVKLDPFSRQIYAVRRKGRLVIQTGIDGYVTLAQRTGRYAGRSLPEWTPAPGKAQQPTQCVVWVYDTRGGKAPGLALWTEHAPDLTDKEAFMWRSRPFEQLEKCAFAKALRALFGAETFAGVYVEDEVVDPAPSLHVEHAPPREEPQEPAGGARVLDVQPEPEQPQEPREPQQAPQEPREPDVAGDILDWTEAFRQCDSKKGLWELEQALKQEMQSGRFDLLQTAQLRKADKQARERLGIST